MTRRTLTNALCLATLLLTGRAEATQYTVDGACPSSGAGVSDTCGPTGPMRTIMEGLALLEPGDTLVIRGAHGAFDGRYRERLTLAGATAVVCTASAPCLIQGDPRDPPPVVDGTIVPTDWRDDGGGVYSRAQEASTQQETQYIRDDYDPHLVIEGDTPLAYAGDATTPARGQWSYDPATHRIQVAPVGAIAGVRVPRHAQNMDVRGPTWSAYVTFQRLAFEGPRSLSIQFAANGPHRGMVLRDIHQRFVPSMALLGNNLPGLIVEDSTVEYLSRGISWGGSGFGYRLFYADNAIIRGNTLRHLGAAGMMRGHMQQGQGWQCAWCDSPWNDRAHTQMSSIAIGIQVKKTTDARIEGNVVEDASNGGISLDVSKRVTVVGNTVRRARGGVSLSNFTPDPQCPTTDPGASCYNQDHVVESNRFETVQEGGARITGTGRHTDGTFLVQVFNNEIVQTTGDPGIWVGGTTATRGSGPPDGVLLANNTIVGDMRIEDVVSDVVVVNNLTTAGIAVAGTALPGTTLTANRTATADEFVAMPTDLHLVATSPARDAGVPRSEFGTDRDGEPRVPPWDVGADEFVAGGGTTSSTVVPPTTTLPSTTTTLPPSTTTTTVAPPQEGCGEVIGFSQTGQWFRGDRFASVVEPGNGFQTVAPSANWELTGGAGAGIDRWADPMFAGWDQTNAPGTVFWSPCTVGNPAQPETIILNVSGDFGADEARWEETIRAALVTTALRRPTARTVYLQPVVGGPDHVECFVGGQRVRASWQHRHIETAIARVVAVPPASLPFTVLQGADALLPAEVGCSGYYDSTGHLDSVPAALTGQAIARFYVGGTSTTLPPLPTSTTTSTTLPPSTSSTSTSTSTSSTTSTSSSTSSSVTTTTAGTSSTTTTLPGCFLAGQRCRRDWQCRTAPHCAAYRCERPWWSWRRRCLP